MSGGFSRRDVLRMAGGLALTVGGTQVLVSCGGSGGGTTGPLDDCQYVGMPRRHQGFDAAGLPYYYYLYYYYCPTDVAGYHCFDTITPYGGTGNLYYECYAIGPDPTYG